jgi:Domain of unknown function (DUF4286)
VIHLTQKRPDMRSAETVFYEVTLQVQPALAAAVEEHMRSQHIPGIFRTGCFERIRFDQASPGRFRTSYQARSQSELDRYLKQHAPAFRAEFQAQFPDGVVLTRETWKQRELWQSG